MKKLIGILFLISCGFVNAAEPFMMELQSGKTIKVMAELSNDYWITEGDIIVGKDRPSAVAIIDVHGSRWPNAEVPFKISEKMPVENKLNIYRAIITLQHKTKVRFNELSANEKPEDYIHFKPSGSTVCASHVGRKGGEQDIVLAPRCKKGSTIHEILHALGMWHEQSRADRDQFIKIIWHNIKSEKQYNFNQHLHDGIDVGQYDYGSIMHYGPFAFSENGQRTIIPLQSNVEIGQREKLSKADLRGIKFLYGKK